MKNQQISSFSRLPFAGRGRIGWLILAVLVPVCGVHAARPQATPASGPPLFRWEAESLQTMGAELETEYAKDASGGKYCYLPHAQKEAGLQPESSLTARFEAPPGRYLARVRALAANRGADSFFVSADDQARQNVNVPSQREWMWREVSVAWSTAGEHTLTISAREPARIDAVELMVVSQEPDLAAVALRQTIPLVPEPNGSRPSDINPPSFRWSGKWDKPYTLQLVPAGSAWEQATQITGIGETFYRPKDPLTVGIWKWRVRAGDEPWLPEQTFKVEEGTARWPIPAWEDMVQRFSRAHPRILCRADELPQLRAKIDGPMKDLVADWTRQLEKTIGGKLALGEDKPAGKTADHRAVVIQRTSSKKDAGAMMSPVEALAFFAAVMNRDDFAREAIRRAMAATQLDPNGYTSQKVSDFANGAIVRNLAQVYDLLYDRLTASERQAIRTCLRARVLGVYHPALEQHLYNAHAWQHVFMDLAHGPLAVWEDDPEMAAWLRWALKMTVAFFPWYGGADGASEEGGNYFSVTNMNTSLRTARFWENACGLDLGGNPWFRNNPWYVIYSCPLSGPISRFGDYPPEYRPPAISRAMAALIQSERTGNPFSAAYANAIIRQRGERAFLQDGPGDPAFAVEWLRHGPFSRVEKRPLTELPPAHVFPQTGLAFIHNDFARADRNVMFEFRSSPYGSFNHAHADQNSFNISAYGDDLIIDSGHYVSYGDAHHAGYTVKQKAHNLILVDRQDEPSRDLAAYGQIAGFDQGRDWAWVMGDARKAYFKTPLARFYRHCVWLRGEQIQTYVIFDAIAAQDGKPHQFEWLLHSATKPEVNAPAQTALVSTKNAQAQVTWLAPRELHYAVTDIFDPPVENWRPDKQKMKFLDQWHLTVEPKSRAPAADFLTVIQVGSKGVPPAATPRLEGPGRLRFGDWLVAFTADTVTLSRAGKMIFSGKAGAVNERDASPTLRQ